MTPKEAIFEAFELKSAGRVPATVFGGGVWTIRHWGKQFGEMIADPYIVQLDAALPAGEYRLQVGLYLLATLQRLPVINSDGYPVDDKFMVSGLIVPEGR